MSCLGLDINKMFHYILTKKGGLCKVQELADGLGMDPEQIPKFVTKNGSSRMKLVQAAFPDRVSYLFLLGLTTNMMKVILYIFVRY